MPVTRREFMLGAAAAGLAVASTNALEPLAHAAKPRPLPSPAQSGIDHIVVLCMENRSFDHYLGWVRGASGKQAGLTYLDDDGNPHETHRLTEWTGCGFNDPDHGYDGGRVQYADGRVDGFRKGDNDDYALGYYTASDLPATSQFAANFTVCDHWFASILGPTYPNRLYTHSAATDRISNTMDVSTMPTIWDRLQQAGVPANYYFSDLPVLGLYGTKYASSARPFAQFYVDAATGTLPAYTYLDPFFLGEGQGGSNDDHPHADIRRGQNLMAMVVDALLHSPSWGSTVLIITYDEWGGFFDHVVPPRFPDLVSNPGGDATNPDHGQAGFRVPAIVVSPFAPPGAVAKTVFEHSAILKLVEWRFGLASLTPRDAAAANLASVLDFTAPNRRPPTIAIPPDPGPQLCGAALPGAPGASTGETFWHELAAAPQLRAFPRTT
jgi:phospholipase C